jgi:hypothetical protein
MEAQSPEQTRSKNRKPDLPKIIKIHSMPTEPEISMEPVAEDPDHISFKSSSTEQEAQSKGLDNPATTRLDKQLSSVLEYESEISSNYMPRECRKLMETPILKEPPSLSDIKEDAISMRSVKPPKEHEKPASNFLVDLITSLSLTDPTILPLAKLTVPIAQ